MSISDPKTYHSSQLHTSEQLKLSYHRVTSMITYTLHSEFQPARKGEVMPGTSVSFCRTY